jgi:hypothetical protein
MLGDCYHWTTVKAFNISSCCALYLPGSVTTHSGDSSNLGFQGDGTKCRQLVCGISQMNFRHQPTSKAFSFVNMFFCGLEVFTEVAIIKRFGTYMVFSPFKVLLFKRKLKGTF